MHKVTSSLTVGSIGDLGHIASALAGEGFNIDAIGGGEGSFDGNGVGVALDGGRAVRDVGFHPSFDVELTDQPGELARAASLIGNQGINIHGVLSVDVHAGWGVVAIGFRDESDRDTARDLLIGEGFKVLDEHGGRDRRAWVDEQIDGAQPPA